MIRQLVSLVAASLLAVLVSLGSGATTPASARIPAGNPAEFTTDVTLIVRYCEDCVVTVFSADGIDEPYSSGPRTVVNGQVTVKLPSVRTAGMSVRVDPPWGETEAETFVAWRYGGTQIGEELPLREVRLKSRASGCWAGTVNEAVSLQIKVRRVSYFGRPSVIAWAAVTQSFVKPMKRVSFGVLARRTVPICYLGS